MKYSHSPSASKRIVLTTFGTHGDIVPFIGLGKALKALGHHPVLATSSYFEPLAREHGIEFAPAAPHHSQLDKDLGMDQGERLRRVFQPVVGGKFMMEKMIYPYMDQICSELDAACEGADLLVAPPTTPWAHMVAFKRKMPWKSVIVQAITLSLQSAQDPPVMTNFLSMRKLPGWIGEERYRRLFKIMRDSGRAFIGPLDVKAKEYGLFDKAINPLIEGTISPLGSIALFVPQMMRTPMPTDLPGHVDFAGFNFFDGNAAPLSDDLKEFLDKGDPPIVFSLGSSLWFHADRLYPGWSKLCSKLGVRAIFLAGDKALQGQLPPTQMSVAWASVGELFPRCKAVVNTAGCGITSQAMKAGIPQLLIPFGMDQPDNTARIVRMGAALTVPPSKLQSRTFESTLERLINDTTLHDNARKLRTEINQTCGTVTAARLLDEELRKLLPA
ncbi:MAG: glycosyltransferase [Burkholderiales bacterium]|nr:glycosyltransferase [Burkholderiales bacterium]